MKRGLIIGVCLGILSSIAFPILFKYTNIIISLLVFFGLIASLGIVVLFVVVSSKMNEALSENGKLESAKKLIGELVRNPSQAGQLVGRNKDVVASVAVPFLLNFGFLSLVAALLSAAATTSLVLVGMQQVNRLDRQNEIMERQMPLLLRQSIAATQTELATKKLRLGDLNSQLLELQNLMSRASDATAARPQNYCQENATLNCEEFLEIRFYDSLDLLRRGDRENKIALAQVNYLTKLAAERAKRWRGALAYTSGDHDNHFLRVTGLQNLIIQCSPDLSPMQSLQTAVLNERKWEALISKMPVVQNPVDEQSMIDKNQLAEVSDLQETYLRGSTRVKFSEMIRRINDQNEANLSEWRALEMSCREKSRFLAQDVGRLEQGLASDQKELQIIMDRQLTEPSLEKRAASEDS